MKFKSLLFAALVAGMSMTASAQNDGTAYTDCGDILSADAVTVKPGEVGIVNVYLTRQTAPDFTNIQFDIVFPEGLRPYLDEDGVYGWSGDDITMVGKPKAPAVAFKDNFMVDEFYPNHRVVGANMTKTAQTANPCQLYCFNVKADENMAGGDYQLKCHSLKYTTYSDDSYATKDEQVLGTVTVDAPFTAVNDLNVQSVKTRKVVENGQVYIIAGEAKYNVMGQKVK